MESQLVEENEKKIDDDSAAHNNDLNNISDSIGNVDECFDNSILSSERNTSSILTNYDSMIANTSLLNETDLKSEEVSVGNELQIETLIDKSDVDTMDNLEYSESNDLSTDVVELNISVEYNFENSDSIIDNVQNINANVNGKNHIEIIQNIEENDKLNENAGSYDLHITNKLLPEQFLKILYLDTCKKGISRLSKQVSREEDLSPVEIITNTLPNIIPNILLSKREEVIPLILCAVRYHEDSKVRDELLNMLFNLIKRPDSEQRRIIIDGCLSFADKVESSRIECELLPQCWEQINHKFSERRLLVSETCGSLSPCTSPDLLSSLVFSMLAQMLEEDRSEEVRISVIKNLSVIITYMIETEKYMKAYDLLERSLNDVVPDVVIETKKSLLPVIGLWALTIDKLKSHFLPHLFTKCFETLQKWKEANIANTDGESNAVLTASEVKFNIYIDCLINLSTVMFAHCLLNAPFSNENIGDMGNIENKRVVIDNSRIPVMKNPLLDVEALIGNKQKVEYLVMKFDDYFKSGTNTWSDINWICDECISNVCQMSVMVFTNYRIIEKMVVYMTTICKIFGKQFTFCKIVPFFETCMQNTGAPFLQDVLPISSPLLTIFLCGVLATFDGEEQVKKLITFIKQCLLTISTQGLSKEYLIYSITSLCKNESLQVSLLNMLRETLVYPASEVKMSTAVILGVLVKYVSKEILSIQLAPAIITLTNDRDISVVISAVPALGSVIESISDKSLLDKVILQIQTLLDDGEYQHYISLQKIIIKTFSKIVPNLETRLRDDFFIPRLKCIAESNHSVTDLTDRLEVAEELITALSATLCCFLSKDVIVDYIIPTLKHLESELKDISPETMDIVVLLLKDAENNIDDDKSSTGSGASITTSTSSKLFGGISSRFDMFKKKSKERDRSSTLTSLQ